jgi:hypothetical protein
MGLGDLLSPGSRLAWEQDGLKTGLVSQAGLKKGLVSQAGLRTGLVSLLVASRQV